MSVQPGPVGLGEGIHDQNPMVVGVGQQELARFRDRNASRFTQAQADRILTRHARFLVPHGPGFKVEETHRTIVAVGNNQPVKLAEFIDAIEKSLGKKARKTLLPLQPGDVADTFADSSKLAQTLGYQPSTSVQKGVKRFVEWYQGDYQKLVRGRKQSSTEEVA